MVLRTRLSILCILVLNSVQSEECISINKLLNTTGYENVCTNYFYKLPTTFPFSNHFSQFQLTNNLNLNLNKVDEVEKSKLCYQILVGIPVEVLNRCEWKLPLPPCEIGNWSQSKKLCWNTNLNLVDCERRRSEVDSISSLKKLCLEVSTCCSDTDLKLVDSTNFSSTSPLLYVSVGLISTSFFLFLFSLVLFVQSRKGYFNPPKLNLPKTKTQTNTKFQPDILSIPKEVKASPRHSSSSTTQNIGTLNKQTPQNQNHEFPIHTVQFDYLPNLPDELSLHQGDTIQLRHTFDDGWAIGYKLCDKSVGAFPLIVLYPPPPEQQPQRTISNHSTELCLSPTSQHSLMEGFSYDNGFPSSPNFSSDSQSNLSPNFSPNLPPLTFRTHIIQRRTSSQRTSRFL